MHKMESTMSTTKCDSRSNLLSEIDAFLETKKKTVVICVMTGGRPISGKTVRFYGHDEQTSKLDKKCNITCITDEDGIARTKDAKIPRLFPGKYFVMVGGWGERKKRRFIAVFSDIDGNYEQIQY